MDSRVEELDRYGSIREKDVDLVLCIAASSIPAVWSLFHVDEQSPVSRHSVSTASGEIDVVLEWPGFEVHVENKIDADFQPKQPERYQARADESLTPAKTALVAPIAYLDAHAGDAELFDLTISYEELVGALTEERSPMADELALIVRHAIEQHRRGRISEVSPERTAFFQEFAALAQARGIPFQQDGTRGPGSGFFYLHSWDEVAGRKVELVAKFLKNERTDIQVSGAGYIAEQLADTFDEEVSVRGTESGTLILGREASFLDPDLPASDQHTAIAKFLDAVEQHRDWWHESGRVVVAKVLAD